MMTQWASELAPVLSIETIGGVLCDLVLKAPEIAAAAGPGQFVAVASGDAPEPMLLPRTFDLHWADPASGRIEVMFRVKGHGTGLLSALAPGDRVRVNGPFGRRIDALLQGQRTVALVGRGSGISPLYLVARSAREGGAVVHSYLSARTEALLRPFEKMRGTGDVVAATDETEPGHLITDRLARDLANWRPELTIVVGSRRLAKAALRLGRAHKFPVYGFADAYMGCGFGHCKGCAVPTVHGYVLACLDGPVIDLRSVNDAYWLAAPA
jgi:dihydroorotate dehydrogenase electron transfer subunit